MGGDSEVRAVGHRMEERVRSAYPPAILDCSGRRADPFGVAAVDVVGRRPAQVSAGCDDVVADLGKIGVDGNIELPSGTPHWIGAEAVVFDGAKRRGEYGASPSRDFPAPPLRRSRRRYRGCRPFRSPNSTRRESFRGPTVRRPRGSDWPDREMPSDLRVPQDLADPFRNPDHGVPVSAARLDEKDAGAGIFRETVGQDTTCRTGADDDVVESCR